MNIFNKITNFFVEVKQELVKVSWPSRQELVGSTVIVIVITSIAAVYIGVIDRILASVLSLMFK